MSTIVTRAGKGSPLTHAEVDANFTNLNTDKLEVGAAFNAAVAATPSVTANTAKVTNATHTGDVTGATALTIAADAVTYAKMQNVSAASRLIGRGDSGAGDPQEITLGANLTMTGTTLSASGGGGASLITAAPTTDQADWNPSGFGSTVGTIKMQPTTNCFLSGLAAGATDQEVTFVNDSAFVICVLGEDSTSTAANRFRENSVASIWILPQESATVRYSATLARWSVIGMSRDVFLIGPRTQMFLPNAGAAISNVGMGSIGTTATLSTVAIVSSPSNPMQETIATQFTNSTSAGTSAARGGILNFMRGATAGRQGFFHTGMVRFTALGATGAVRAGMQNVTSAVTTLNAALNQCLFLGADAGMTNLRIFSGDGSAGTPVDLGANFPTPSATAVYEYCFYAPPATAAVQYMVRRHDTRFVAQGTLTTSIPTNTTSLCPRIEIMVGATGAANTAQMAYLLTQGL
jgi:Repeat of unknown function (DUF5907)